MGVVLQRGLLDVVAWTAAPRLARRTRPRPELGRPTYLTTVLRLPPFELPPLDLPARHHRYPPGTVHVTVANVDGARAPSPRPWPAWLAGRCRWPASRSTAWRSRPTPCSCAASTTPASRRCGGRWRRPSRRLGRASPVHRWTTWANVVRFDGAGRWVSERRPTGVVEAAVLEVVRTDRYLSDEGTEVLAAVPLGHRHPGDLSG